MNAPINQTKETFLDVSQAGFCSGFGQYHSENHPTNPQPYLTITGKEIEAMVKSPVSVQKDKAQWAVFSILKSRIHSEQKENGQFVALWVDIDEKPVGSLSVIKTVRRILPGTRFLSYTTKSATNENPKCRVIIFLASLCPGEDYVLIQKILNDRLQAAGIVPDRKTEAAGQICYLPNRGAFYQHHIEQGKPCDWETVFADELAAEKEKQRQANIALQERREQSRQKAIQRMATGSTSPIDSYNAAYSVEDLLPQYGYQQRGNRWISPQSSSGSPGVSIEGNKCISSHESDRQTIGAFADAFDLFTYYEHQNDRSAALKAAGEMFTQDGVSLNKANQRAYMAGQPQSNPATSNSTDVPAESEQWEPSTPAWPVMGKKAYRGLARDFVDLATQGSEADPAAVLATFIVRFGVEVGPDVYMNIGDTKHRARLAAVVVGASSKARKGTSGKPVERLFDFSNIAYSNGEPYRSARSSKGPFSSGEGIIHAIRDSVSKWNAKEGVEEIVDPGVEDKRLFVLDEEFGGVLANTKREGNTLSMIIRQAWDSGNFDPLTKNNKTTATGGHVGWVSHITLQELHAKLGESEGFNGFANRILWICARRDKLVAMPKPMSENLLGDIRGRLIGILEKVSGGTVVEMNQDAKNAWCSTYYADLTKDRPGLSGCVTNRGEAQALRLAMIYCLLDGETIITLDHLEAGIALWEYCRQSANYIFHGRQTDNTAQTILEALQIGPMTSTDIFKLFKNNVTKERLEGAMSELIASNQMTLEEVRNHKGRPTKLYHFTSTSYELNESNELNTTKEDSEPIKFVNSLNSLSDEIKSVEVFDI